MIPSKREPISGWGNCPQSEGLSWRPEKQREIVALVKQHDDRMLARGLGRSYGDASLQPHGSLNTQRLDHLIEFDTSTRTVRAQAGLSLAALMEISIPRGFLPPVIPGTKHVTLGGAFACNVHGKNHWRDGDFAEHVESIRLILASGERVECSRNEHRELFFATAGGMGMTGIIEDLTLKLKPIASCSLKTQTKTVSSISEMIAAFEAHKNSADYMVGWIDHAAKGAAFGRGVFEAANHTLAGEGGEALANHVSTGSRFQIPFYAPSWLLNSQVMALYNRWRFHKYSSAEKQEIVNFETFFHPLDRLAGWNKLYGKRGFFQYQCILPESPSVARHLEDFLRSIHEQRLFSFLAVIKYHRDSEGFITFPIRGYSIALDFPNTARVRTLLPQLDRWVSERGGRVYLAKDVLLSPELFRRMYAHHVEDWFHVIRHCDPAGKFMSFMSERLKWKN